MQHSRDTIRKGRKFDQVLAGARQVFLADGFEGASVDDIARAAGVSKATLYSYFPDKRLLFMEVARLECDQMADRIMQGIDGDLPLREMLLRTARNLTSFLLSDFSQAVFRVCVAERDRFPELGQRLLAQQAFLEGLIAFATSHEMILDVHGHEGFDAHLGLVFLFIFLLSEK